MQHLERCGPRLRRAAGTERSQASIWRAAFLPGPIADGHGAVAGHHVAAGEDARRPGHQRRSSPDGTVRVEFTMPGSGGGSRVDRLPERQDDGVGGQRLEVARSVAADHSIQLHQLDRQFSRPDGRDRRQPIDPYALGSASCRPRTRARACARGRAGRRSASPRRRVGGRCAPHRSRCCRRHRPPRAGRAAAPAGAGVQEFHGIHNGAASRAGMSTCLPRPAPMATNTASKPALPLGPHVGDLGGRRRSGRPWPVMRAISALADHGAGGRPECRTASSARLGPAFADFDTDGRAGPDDRRRTGPTAPRQ